MKTYKERANDISRKLKKRRQQRRALGVSAALVVCILAAVLFVPYRTTPPDVSMYAGSDYYDLIRMLNEYHYTPPQYRNNFEKWSSSLLSGQGDMGSTPEVFPPLYEVPVGDQMSIEITDNQVDGVYEGDLIKRTDTHIFYLSRNVLEIYTIAGENTERVSLWQLESNEQYDLGGEREMFMSADGKTVTLVLPYYFNDTYGEGSNMIQVVNLDVSDPGNIKQKGTFCTLGAYRTARYVDGDLLLLSRCASASEPDYDDPSTFVPMVGSSIEDLYPISGDKIQLPTEMSNGSYTVVTILDGDTLEILDAGAVLSTYDKEIYVSQERIYVCRSYAMVEENGDFRYSTPMTEISCMGYGPDGLKMLGTFQVEGTVQNQYSMDEYNGIFRVVTTVSRNGYLNGYLIGNQTGSSASLTCFYVDTWEEAGKLERFAPKGESVQSVRFEENYAYVCTAVLASDPVFFIDMTDLSNITAKDTGTIDGYSSSLIQLGDGLLMGIGYSEEGGLKVEIYRETEDGVESVCAYERPVIFATDYKAYYIDRANRYFGIPTLDGYVLLYFNGTELVELANVPPKFLLDDARGVVIDQWLYVFGNGYQGQGLYKAEKEEI